MKFIGKKAAICIICAALALLTTACGRKENTSSMESQESSQVLESSIPEESALPAIPEPTTETPSGTVALAMDAILGLDTDSLSDYAVEIIPVEALDSYIALIGSENVRDYAERVSFEIAEETITGDSAEIQLEITAPDLTDLTSNMITEATKYVTTQTLTGKPIELEAFILTYVKENASFDELPVKQAEVTVTVAKQPDGTWLLDNASLADGELYNALSGGVIEKLQGFQKYFPA